MKEKFNMESIPINNFKEKENIITNIKKNEDYTLIRQISLRELYTFLYDVAHIISSASYKLKHPDDTSIEGLFEYCCKKILENHPNVFEENNLQMYFLKSADLIKELHDQECKKSFLSTDLQSLYHSIELMAKNIKYGSGIKD